MVSRAATYKCKVPLQSGCLIIYRNPHLAPIPLHRCSVVFAPALWLHACTCIPTQQVFTCVFSGAKRMCVQQLVMCATLLHCCCLLHMICHCSWRCCVPKMWPSSMTGATGWRCGSARQIWQPTQTSLWCSPCCQMQQVCAVMSKLLLPEFALRWCCAAMLCVHRMVYLSLQLQQLWTGLCCCAEYDEHQTVCACPHDSLNSVIMLCVRSVQGRVFGQQGPVQSAWRTPRIHLC